MSWLLKEATVLSSAIVIQPKHHFSPWIRRGYLEQDQALILLDHHFVTSLLLPRKVILVKCDSDLHVVGLSQLKPNRLGGASLKPIAWVLIPDRVVAHVDLHVGDQLEIRN